MGFSLGSIGKNVLRVIKRRMMVSRPCLAVRKVCISAVPTDSSDILASLLFLSLTFPVYLNEKV